jgi:hypothetical protein
MADKVEDKGDKVEDKGDKVEDKGGFGGLLGAANGMNGGGWVVVSFIGQAGLDVRRLASAILLGSGQPQALRNAAADALAESRKRADAQEKLLKVVQSNALAQKRALALSKQAGGRKPRAKV